MGVLFLAGEEGGRCGDLLCLVELDPFFGDFNDVILPCSGHFAAGVLTFWAGERPGGFPFLAWTTPSFGGDVFFAFVSVFLLALLLTDRLDPSPGLGSVRVSVIPVFIWKLGATPDFGGFLAAIPGILRGLLGASLGSLSACRSSFLRNV